MRVVIRQESAELAAQHRSFIADHAPRAVLAIGLSALTALVFAWPVSDADDTRGMTGFWIVALVAVVLVAAAVIWLLRKYRNRKTRLSKDSLWVSDFAMYVGPHGAEGVGVVAAWAELLPGDEYPIVFVVLKPRSFEIVNVRGLPETLSIPLDDVESVDIVFARRRKRQGLSIRLKNGSRADFVGKPDRRLAEHLRSLGAEVVAA